MSLDMYYGIIYQTSIDLLICAQMNLIEFVAIG